MQANKKTRILTFCSGKGGVGKSVIAANLAYNLAMNNVKTLLWDADMFFPNLHLILGAEPPVRLRDVYAGKIRFDQAVFRVSDNLDLLADLPASGSSEEFNTSALEEVRNQIVRSEKYDIVLLDTPAGASLEVLQCCSFADLVSIMITDEPTSLLDAYGLVKILLQFIDTQKIKLLVNNVIDMEDADEISYKLNLATENFLKVQLGYMGFIPYERIVRQSILQQELFSIIEPESEVSKAIEKISDTMLKELFEKSKL